MSQGYENTKNWFHKYRMKWKLIQILYIKHVKCTCIYIGIWYLWSKVEASALTSIHAIQSQLEGSAGQCTPILYNVDDLNLMHDVSRGAKVERDILDLPDDNGRDLDLLVLHVDLVTRVVCVVRVQQARGDLDICTLVILSVPYLHVVALIQIQQL